MITMADDTNINRYDTPNPRNGIGKSGIAAVAIAIACAITITLGSLAMIFHKEPEQPLPTPPGQTDVDPGVTDPGVTDPGVTDPGVTDPGENPGGSDINKEESRELNVAEKIAVVQTQMFGVDYDSIDLLKEYVNDECFMEIDGQDVEAIKVIYEAAITKQNGTVDYRTVSATTPINETNQNMDASELATYLFDTANTDMVVKGDYIHGEFEFNNTAINRVEGSRTVRETVKSGSVVDAEGYARIECLRDNLCVAAGYNTNDYDVIVTDLFERDVNNRGDVEFVIGYDVYDEFGCVIAHHVSVIPSDAKFKETVLQDEILSGTRYDMSDIITSTVEVDRNGNPLTVSADQSRSQ